MRIATRTGEIEIDLLRCSECRSFACIKACSLYGAGILRLKDGLPALLISTEEARRRCLECLACELACQLEGLDVLRIKLPVAGLPIGVEAGSCGDPAG